MENDGAHVQVRLMKTADVPRIAELEKICFSAPWSENALAQSLQKPEYTFFVAEIEGVIAGYAGMIRALDEGDVTDVAVFPAYRGRGAAYALMTALRKQAGAQGIVRIFLEVRESNAAALSLYEKSGFQRIGVRKNFYDAPRENAVLMSCDTGLL